MAAGGEAVLIRPARPEDAEALVDVHVRTWAAAYEHVFGAERLATIDRERRRAIAAWWIESGGTVVAELDGRVVGLASVGPSTDVEGEGELYAIYVLPEAWGGGAGRGLMDAAKELLRASYRDATLYVLDDNPRARRFYEREGWAVDGVTKTEEWLGLEVTEVRYRISLAAVRDV
jgi:ribosomal protein S18 acetylase RimI-like enzyme